MKTSGTTSRVGRRSAVLAGLAAMSLALASCGGDESAAGQPDAYRVGVLLGLTGSYAALGEPEQRSIELYFERLNADGGIDGRPVELVVLDSASDEGTVVNQFRKLATEEQVHAVLGPSSSGEAIALRPFSGSLMVPTIALASSSDIVQPADEAQYIFKQYPGTDESLEAQLQFAAEQGWTNVGLLHTNDGYGQDPARRFEDVAAAAGVAVTGIEPFDAGATDVTAQLGSLADDDPDAVLVWAVDPANAIVATNAESIGFEPVLFHSPGAGSDSYITTGGAAVEETYLQGSIVLASESIDEDNPQYEITHQLVDAFSEEYGEPAGQHAANGWDSSLLLVEAIRAADEHDPSDVQATRDAIRASLENNTTEVVGVNAIYTFTPDFHGSKELTGLAVLKVTNGVFEVVQTY